MIVERLYSLPNVVPELAARKWNSSMVPFSITNEMSSWLRRSFAFLIIGGSVGLVSIAVKFPAYDWTRTKTVANCIKLGLPGKLILSKRKGLREVIFS